VLPDKEGLQHHTNPAQVRELRGEDQDEEIPEELHHKAGHLWVHTYIRRQDDGVGHEGEEEAEGRGRGHEESIHTQGEGDGDCQVQEQENPEDNEIHEEGHEEVTRRVGHLERRC